MGNTLADIKQLHSLVFQHKQIALAKVVSEENRLRRQLNTLSAQEKEADACDQHMLKATGADVVWKAWLSKTRRNLNTELAQILAQKERLLDGVRKDHGKMLASGQLEANQRTAKQKKQNQQTLTKAIESYLTYTGKGQG